MPSVVGICTDLTQLSKQKEAYETRFMPDCNDLGQQSKVGSRLSVPKTDRHGVIDRYFE